jgi:type IV pilus assembly protein PilQ
VSWMNWTCRAVSDRVVPRVVRCCAILGGPLLMLFILAVTALGQSQQAPTQPVQSASPQPASAQDRDTGRLFQSVRRGTETPAVAHAPPAERRARQPGYYGGGLRLAQAQNAQPSAPRTESLPTPPQSETSTMSPSAAPSANRVEGTLPISGWDADVDIAQGANGRIDRLVVRDASLSKVLALLAQTYHLNIVAANDIDAVISITLRDVPLEEALTAILSVANYTWVNRGGIIMVTSLADTALAPDVQGRVTEIFDLDFVSAAVISETVTNFLSPIGKMTVTESDPTDNRRTREMIVVEDIPDAIARIANYICEVDCPPKQVLIEAHILEVLLKDEERNGVNFNALARIAGARVNLKTVGFANPAAPTAFLSTINGTDLTAVIELLQNTNDTKTLGSPKVLVLNQQEATVHVGEDLGYQTTVITELQSTQAPQFLQIGVLLRITPRITRDNRVLLKVRPEVSSGEINPLTQVPNKRTTELETDVMLNDGEGMVIGGLINEKDDTNQSKIPYLGDMWRVGFLFRKSTVTKERKEVIIALIPRIQPYSPEYSDYDQGEWVRSDTPLFKGPLCYVDRPDEPRLPDGKRVAKTYIPPRAKLPEAYRYPCNYCEAPYPRYYVPNKPFPEQHPAGVRDDKYGPYDGPCDDGCETPGLAQPDAWGGGEYQGEFVSEQGGYAPADGGYDAGSDTGNGAGYGGNFESGSPFSDDSIISDGP